MENIDSQRIAILEQRLNELETRVSQLENPKPVTGGTLKRAIEALADKVGQMGETFSNEGRKGRYIIGHDGRRHPVFIAASRNLGSDTGKPMSGWHSINPRNADTTRFGAYILSVEESCASPCSSSSRPRSSGPCSIRRRPTARACATSTSAAPKPAWIGSLTGATAAWT